MTELVDRLAHGPCNRSGGVEEGWRPHPKFPGVRMKSLVTGKDNAGAFSTLLVKLEPGRAMLPHTHEKQDEQHLVLAGDGHVTLAGDEHAYSPGALIVIPRNTEHSVVAGKNGMVLTALFCPAID